MVMGSRSHSQERGTKSQAGNLESFPPPAVPHCCLMGFQLNNSFRANTEGLTSDLNQERRQWKCIFAKHDMPQGNVAFETWPLEKAGSMGNRGKLAFSQNSGLTVLGDSIVWFLIWWVLTKEPSLSSISTQLICPHIHSTAHSRDTLQKETQKTQLSLIMNSRCLFFHSTQNNLVFFTRSTGSFSS